MAEPLDQRIQLVISKGQVREIDEWRRRQPDLPSRSEAIRRLIEAGLNAEVSNGPKPGRPMKS
jgi:metal-responsive CopG/Arc/MetJ family transcriptional regulator